MARVCDEYASLPDFILGITERIWEGRDLDLIRRTYASDVVMHTGLGDSRGVESVVAGTLETLHSFPDRRLLGEDVIWSGAGASDAYSSHRIASVMHHRGDGVFGTPTGRRVLVRTVADCRVRDGLIVEEWLVRDQGAIAAQIGVQIGELAARIAARRGAVDADPMWGGDPPIPMTGTGADAGDAAAGVWHAIWNETRLAEIGAHFDPAVMLHLPGGRVDSGVDALDAFVVGYRAAFPDARLSVDHVITRRDPERPVRVALRWTLRGHHTGRGAFGAPSDAAVVVPGITHYEITAGRVTRAFVLVDELAIHVAIAAARG